MTFALWTMREDSKKIRAAERLIADCPGNEPHSNIGPGGDSTPFLGSMQCLIEAEKASGRVRPEVDTHLASALVIGALGQIARIAHFRELPKQPNALADNLIDHGPGCYASDRIRGNFWREVCGSQGLERTRENLACGERFRRPKPQHGVFPSRAIATSRGWVRQRFGE